ncbi:MAG: NAD(P)-dependent oxidoreductase [Lachnospiraceae bacterium]|nr:NAD(P)-dependent oxidoreductase [Lachnospiraceae bacterium]
METGDNIQVKQSMIHRTIRNAVVTGPTGAIGTALCKKLLSEGIHVWAVCRPGSARAADLPEDEHLDIVYCDAKDILTLPDRIPVRVQAFFHLAWAHTIGEGRNDMIAQTENIQYTLYAVQCAARLGCQVFIGAGSQAEYGRVNGPLRADTPCNPENGYGMAKLCAGQMSRVEAGKLQVAHVWPRVLSVYGPHEHPSTMTSFLTKTLLRGEKPALTAGEQIWDYLYSADAADAFYRMAVSGRDGAVYPLGSGEARPLKEYIGKIRDTIDPALPLGLGEIPYGKLQVMHLEADITALKEDTGFEAHTDFATGIKETIDWIRSRENE